MDGKELQKTDGNKSVSKIGNLLSITNKITGDMKTNNILLFAKHYFSLGLNVTCMSNHINEFNFFSRHILKSPNHQWKHLLTQRQTLSEFESYDWNNATGVGCTTGLNNICAIDIDGCSDYNFLEDALEILGLPKNYEWVVQSGSKNGFHIIIQVEKFEFLDKNQVVTSFPPSDNYKHLFDKVEILWNTNLVLPPSIHNSGQTYEFVNCKIPTNPPMDIRQGTVGRKRVGNLLKFIDKFLDFEKISIGSGYGEILFEFIPPNIPSNLNQENIANLTDGEISCIVDITTDGLPKAQSNETGMQIEFPNVIQIAWILMDDKGNILKKESELINFIGIKQTEAFSINNIDINLVKKIGREPTEVYKKFVADVKISSNVVAHNADFDFPIIKNQLQKYFLQDPFKNKRIVCTMKETVHYCNIVSTTNELKFPKLTELYEKLFNYKIEQRNNAESDALLTAKCFKELVNKEIINLDNS
jgi:DNA polymerase III epsilon subunit-like protein